MSKQHYQVSTYKAQKSAGYLLKRAHSLMIDSLEAPLAERGFSFVQYVILSWLRDGIAVNPKDFCAQFRHDSGALTRVIDQLAERGLVERHRCDQDRRKVNLHLTPAGLATCEQLIPLVVEKLNRAVDQFSRAELDELIRLLGKFIDGIQVALAESPAGAAREAAPAREAQS